MQADLTKDQLPYIIYHDGNNCFVSLKLCDLSATVRYSQNEKVKSSNHIRFKRSSQMADFLRIYFFPNQPTSTDG